ncbi:MAG: tetratricopeptide repeat protein [Kofleriaceae bacterium]|nr:tetratricopeptide repeat protein [Kofleriaceae bacterium]
MADLSALLAVLEHDPDDAQALDTLESAARSAPPELAASRFAAARKLLSGRGRPDAVVALIDVELAITDDKSRKADLFLEKGMVLDGELLDAAQANIAYASVLELRKGDAMATEALEELGVAGENWQKFAAKFIQEANASTDRNLATGLYASAAEQYVRWAPDAPEAEQYLRKSLEIDPKNRKAAFHLARLLRRANRWEDLGELLDDRAEKSAAVEDKVAALVALSEVARDHLGNHARSDRAIKRVLAHDPSHPRALRHVTDAAAAAGDWIGVVQAYQAALKARREGDDLGMLLQIAMVLWKHMNELEQAEEYFRRIRKIEPAHPAALDFYRAYYAAKGESGKLISLLKSVEKGAPRARSESGEKSISIEIAELAEAQNNPEKAIEAYKQHLRQDPTSVQARTSLARLYRRTEKWNALLDLMKDEIEKLPEGDIAGRVARYFEVVEVYRDRLRLDVMVINTYHAILKLDPDNQRATDELAAKFRALGRWNDLIAILTKKSEAAGVPDTERVRLLREVADLWSERFGNFANAIKPLERIAELAPTDTEAVGKLKEIYTKRRQWRQLIDLLGKEASTLFADDKRAKQGEMARLAAERLGDTRLAIEIHNQILVEAPDAPETLAALAALYDREKRWPAYAEILHRQVAALRAQNKSKEATTLLEKLGQVYAERLSAPQQAAAAWKEILDFEPNHAKALRTLRELYAMAGDFAGLEQLYAKLGQEDELVEALLAIADRIDAKAARLPLVERAAQLAQKRAENAKENQAAAMLEKARQVWERVLAVEPTHVGAATALAPIYTKQEKWARLITMLEIELGALHEVPARLAKIAEIRQLVERRLSSRNLAFTWTIRAFDLDPNSEALYTDVLRLASEAEQWREVVAAFERAIAGGTLAEPIRLKLFRELAKIASKRLGDAEKARGYHRQVLQLAPEDRDAEASLEDLAHQVADWNDLLASYRKRAERETETATKASLLMEIAALQEQKLVDLDGAAATYREVLALVPAHLKALRALARLDEARGDWDSLAEVLAEELKQTPDGQPRYTLLMRVGQIEEMNLDAPANALDYYRDALGIPAVGGGARPEALDAVARIVLDPNAAAQVEPKDRQAAARQILPHLERAHDSAKHAATLEVIRTGEDTGAAEKIEIDRALMRIYHIDLGDPGAAWVAGLRVLRAEPADADVRGSLAVLAGQLGRDGEWARELSAALAALRGKGGSSAEIRAIATELAVLAGDRLDDRPTAERAWLTVLEVEPDAADAFDALIAMYTQDERWADLRAMLERRAEVSADQVVRLYTLVSLAELEAGPNGDSERAGAAYRRVLDIDASYGPAYAALDKLYSTTQRWKELEELLARQGDYLDGERAVDNTYRRAELWAKQLGDPSRAVDLLEDVIAKARSHADGRELLEELMTAPNAQLVMMRIVRLLEPLYEQDKLWMDLVGLLRAQRPLVTGTEAVELLSRIATIEERELGGAPRAFDAWIEVLRLEPAHERARVEIARLAQFLSRWPEATVALEAAVNATPDGDAGTRAALLGELATYYDSNAGDTVRAITAYKRLLEADPSSPTTIRRAGTSLARLYEQSQNWKELRAITRQQAEWAEDPEERRALLAKVAQLDEEKLADHAAAIATWRDVLADQPADAGALDALERLYQAAENWRELVDILRRKIDAAGADADVAALLARVAELHERKLDEPEEAIAAWLEIIDRDSEDVRALNELARLYRAAERYADLLDVHERQVMLYDGPAQTDLQIQIARLLEGPLARPVEALERWATILRGDPQHPTALAAVQQTLGDVDLRVSAAEILRPVYAATGREDELARLALLESEWADDPAIKLRALLEVVQLREFRLGDIAGAFEAQVQALHYAVTEPELAQVVADTERLAGELGRDADLIDIYREVAPNVLDAEIQRRLRLDIADLARGVRKDNALAAEYYKRVLDSSPEDRRALVALESIYRETSNEVALVEILLRQADIADDVDDKVGELVEAAGIYTQLGRSDDAIQTWEQVLQIAPERGDVIYALESLYAGQGRWHDVVDLYERRLGFVTSIEEAVALRVQLGELQEKQLHDVEAAIENYSAALGGNARQPQAIAALERLLNDPDARVQAAGVLEPVYIAQHSWPELVRVYDAKLEGASEPAERIRLTRFVARLYEEQLEDFENACKWYARLFRETPGDAGVREQLQRLGGIVENWPFVAETYQSYLDDENGDSDDVRDVAIAAGLVYERRLGNIDAAFTVFRRALAIEPEEQEGRPTARDIVAKLEDMLGRHTKWNELLSIYDDVVGRTDEDLRREALVKKSRLLENGLGDPARAIDAWREVVLVAESGESPILEQTYIEAVRELQRLYTSRSQWHDLIDLTEARLARASDASQFAEAAQRRLELAEIYELHLNDLTSALDQYEEVIRFGHLWDKAVASLERLVIHDEHRERIAELLEPVYREQDWWQKLVVILDAKLEYVTDPAHQVVTLHEIAELHEERGGAIDLALAALARAWRIDVADDAALAKLLVLAGKLGAWDEAARTIEDGAASTDGELAATLWTKAAQIHEAQRNDGRRAIDAWRKVDETRSDDPIALAALDRLLALEGRVEELVKIVERRANLSEDAGVRLVLLHRVAALYEEVLEDKPNAITAYKNVLDVDDSDLAALDALERLYRDTGDAREMVATLERKIELTSDLPMRQELRFAAATVYEHHLDDVYQAIGQLTAILDDDAGDAKALAELDRIYAKQKMWPELLDIVDKRALLAITAQDRADLAFRAANIVEVQLTDPDGAIPRYGAVLQILATHPEARAALEALMAKDEHIEAVSPILERIYRSALSPRADAEAAGLIRVYERRLTVAGRDPADRRADWQALAEVRETINQPAQAFVVWGRAFADEPDDVELLVPLMRLAESQNLWRELAGLLDERLDDGAPPLPPDVEATYAMRLGQIAEDRLSDLDRAALAFGRASQGPEPKPPLAALERVLARSGRWPDLALVLRRQAEVTEEDVQTADYLFRLGDLQETTLSAPREAIAAYREVLQLIPTHAQARGALERLLTRVPEEAGEIVEILEPLFEADGDAARLLNVLEAKLGVTSDPLDRAGILARIVELAEGKLADRARALDAAIRWLAVDPASEQALAETERLADRLGQWRETATRIDAIVHAADAGERDNDVQVGLLVFLGKILRDRLGQNDDAITTYRAALQLEPDSLDALDPLVEILRQRGEWSPLADVLRARGRIVQELPEKRAAFAEVAQISERGGDRDGAIEAWREIADADETDRDSLDQLARIYRSAGNDPVALIEVLGRAARIAANADDEKTLRVEIAQLESEGPRGVAAWQAVVDLDPDDANALSALEAAHARSGDWIAVSDIQMRRLDLAKTSQEKVLIHAEMARLAETRRNSVDDAIAAWYAALDIDSSYVRGYDELERLLASATRYHDLVELLEKRAELHATLNQNAAEIQALARAADVWEGKLDNPDAAGEILEKILAREPGSVAALTRLSKIYERSGDWEKCKSTLEQALRLNPQGRDAADLFFRLGEVARVGDSDEDTAIQHFQHTLRHDPSHADAIAALEKLARDRRDNALLADMLQRRVAALTNGTDRLSLLVEIAELERKAGRNDAALEALAKAAKQSPDDVRVLGPLADLYFAAGRLDEAAPIYDRLAQDAKAQRRMKDVAKFRQRQGGILEARGDATGALAAYEEALRVNPTDVVTMTGLGRMYFAAGDWEKARKIYQSLVLQNIDAEVGVTKGEVYWALGKIHIELGQGPKAKSMFQRGLEIEPGNQKLRDALSSLS